MSEVSLLDTGPLVAFLNRADRQHSWALATLGELQPPLLTCEAVVSEACFLLRGSESGVASLLALLERGLVAIRYEAAPDIPALRHLLARYASVPMSFADACLVRMSELHSSCRLFTLDRDFRVYRRHGRQTIPVVGPVR